MALVTVSEKRNRTYPRMFDHDECRRLRAEDPKWWTYTRLADRFGVSYNAIRRVVDPAFREALDGKTRAWFRKNRRALCKGGCGTLVWTNGAERSGYCVACAGALVAAPNVRPDELRCTGCGEWKPDDDFYRSRANRARRGRTTNCKTCQNAARRDYRHRNQAREARYSNDRYRMQRERSAVATYIVFQPNGKGFVEFARVDAATPAHAIEKTAQEPGEYVAVPEGKFKVMRVAPVERLTVVTES